MAATTTMYVDFGLLFEDDTTKTLSFGPFNPTNAGTTMAGLKAKVMAFEANFNSDTAKLMTSKYGNDWAGFDTVKIITTSKNVLF